jgi:hypothetical protein
MQSGWIDELFQIHRKKRPEQLRKREVGVSEGRVCIYLVRNEMEIVPLTKPGYLLKGFEWLKKVWSADTKLEQNISILT